MSVGPIWWTAVQEYCDKLGLDSEQQEAMHFHIKAMDLAYMKHIKPKDGKSGPIQQKHQKEGLSNRKRRN
jgi:hypothetical protein